MVSNSKSENVIFPTYSHGHSKQLEIATKNTKGFDVRLRRELSRTLSRTAQNKEAST